MNAPVIPPAVSAGTAAERCQELFNSERPTPQATIEALMYSLRRGVGDIDKPDTQRRLTAIDQDQLKEVCRRVQNFNPHIATPWSREEATALVSNWRILRGKAYR